MRMLAYALLMIVLTPAFLVGLVFYMVPIVRTRGRVSGTTYEPFNGRLAFHLLGSRPDPATRTLARGLPANNAVVMGTIIHPLVWASKLTGFVPSPLAYPPSRPTPFGGLVGARCEFFDAAMREHSTDGTQVVILGAGWDTRAYGLLEGRAVNWFEVDAPATQTVKRAAIAKSGLDARHVRFVSCDFNRQSWLDALAEQGFDPTRRTFVLWEGVTMYLDEDAIVSTLRSVASLPPGSRIAFDFLSREWLEETREGRSARRSMSLTYGEDWIYGFSVRPHLTTALGDFLKAQGLSLAEHRPMGDEQEGGLPFGGLAIATRTV